MKLLFFVGLPLYKTKLWEKNHDYNFLVVQVLYFLCHCSNDQVIGMWFSYKSTKKRENKSVNNVPNRSILIKSRKKDNYFKEKILPKN